MSVHFVAGATGLTGRNVVAELCRRGQNTIAHVRPDSSRRSHWETHFAALGAAVNVSPWDEAALVQSLSEAKVHTVYGLLGTTKKRGRQAAKDGKDESYETIDYGLTSMLVRASVSAGAKRFVYLSSMGTTPKTTNAYLKARARIEGELAESGLSWVAARPAIITGERDDSRPFEDVGKVVGDGLLSVVGVLGGKRIAAKYRSQSGVQLAHALVELALDASHEGPIENDVLRRLHPSR